jgi:phosphoinositide-3-kinase regulatory subunit 4
MSNDKSSMVRATLAKCIPLLAESSLLFLELFEALRDSPTFDVDHSNLYHMNYDLGLKALQDGFQDILLVLLTDPSSGVKKSLLMNTSRLCIFLGRQKSCDFLISHLITFLNDSEWTLRSSFCESVVGIGTFIGAQGLEQFILPLLIMALTGIFDSIKIL